MQKTFVPLNSNASPSQNPYEVRTYLGEPVAGTDWKIELCVRERKCDVPDNSTISKVLTIEDELRRLRQRAKESRCRRQLKAKCEFNDDFTLCTNTRRTPKELKSHAIMRERYLQTQYDMNRRIHDASRPQPEAVDIVQLNSPVPSGDEASEDEEDDEEEEEGEEMEEKPVKPKAATPDCSEDIIYMPPKKMLELKRPKSGYFHNETEPPLFLDDNLPYGTYNPRTLQEEFDAQQLPTVDIIEGKDPNDLWTWNVGLQQQQSQLDQDFIKATLQNFDCANIELTAFVIPKDLDKTFTAEIVFGNDKIIPDETVKKHSFFNRPKEIACLFIAYVESFRFNPDFWTADTMDAILVAAEKLYKKSIAINYKASDMDFDIIPQILDKQAVVGLKVHFTGALRNEPNIYKVLSLYFSKYSAAVLHSKKLFFLIWKRCQNSYYVYDPNGRNEQCERDFIDGKSSLMATRFVEHLVHLIVNFSEADMESEFHLYEIFLINYGKITQPPLPKSFPKISRKMWAVVNDSFAIIPAANNGLQQPIAGTEQNASMIISLLALLYANIERPPMWRMEVIDDLVKFGQNYYKAFVKKLKLKRNQHINITDLPERVMMGAFRAALQKSPFLYTGHVADCKSFLDSQLTVAVKELFSNKWESALLQIDNSVLALWRDKELFYIFDPFRRGRAGQVLDPEDYLTKGLACLHLHTNFESFCRVLYQKALKMRRGGKFFLHGVSIGCIRPITSGVVHKNKYTRLQLTLPKYTDTPEPVKKDKKGKKGKKGKVERTYSIHTLPDEDRIPEYEDVDVVNAALDEILCEIFKALPDSYPARPQIYKQAEKVLMRSDKDYLESMRYKLKHEGDGDDRSEYTRYPEEIPQPLTLEQELQIASNYEMLPDGTWIIFGTTPLSALVDDESMKLTGLLSGLITAALTAKYKVSTWTSELIEFAIESVAAYAEAYQSYEHGLSALLSRNLPKLSIGQNTFYFKVQKIIQSTVMNSLRQMLLASLINYNRLFVICQRFSCLIIKRYNFLYMFIGFPCNTVGFRKFGSGPACMLRFVELDSLIRRIEFGCNPQGCEISNYVAVAIKPLDITNEPPERFRRLPTSQEEALYNKEYEKQQKMHQRRLEKMRLLDMELRKENERIKKFLAAKEQRAEERRLAAERRRQRYMKNQKSQADGDLKDIVGLDQLMGEDEEAVDEEDDIEEGEEEGEEEEEVELKHKPGKKLQREIIDEYRPRPILYGYRMRHKDCMFKIQGNTALQGRAESSLENIKPCFFVSVVAIMYAILRPLNQWNSKRIDRVIDSGKLIASRVSNMATADNREIQKINVDDYEFDVLVSTFQPAGVWGSSLDREISKALQTRRYLLLQTSNCTYAIVRDEFYHLFDPYGSMELTNEEENDQEDEKGGKKKCTKKFKRYGEHNTASWVLFADVDTLLKYIDQRAPNAEWKEQSEYKFHVINVKSYKKAAAKTRILQLLTDLSMPMDCKVSPDYGEDESIVCTYSETITWLDLENCLPIWSRMNRRNTAGRYRNLPVTKLKKYDIEIDGRLWSLWGNLHPLASVFDPKSRGKQHLACNVMALCATRVYRLADWSPQLLDTIVISGDRYHRESMANIKQKDYEFSLEDLNIECNLEHIKFVVHIELVAFGKLYSLPSASKMNLADALMYFFSYYQFGVLQCQRRSLAIGRIMGHDGGYFMYDCQSRENPIFPKGQGSSYLLRSKYLQVLLYCIIVTLNIPYYNISFTLHKVDMLREGASVEEEEEEAEGEH